MRLSNELTQSSKELPQRYKSIKLLPLSQCVASLTIEFIKIFCRDHINFFFDSIRKQLGNIRLINFAAIGKFIPASPIHLIPTGDP